MTDNTYGVQTTGDSASETNALMFMVQRMLAKIRTIDLVTVVSCSNTGGVSPVGTVNVIPLVNQMTGNRVAVPHGTIYNLPYFRIQGGLSAVILDPKAGDVGLAAFCARDTSSVQSAANAAVAANTTLLAQNATNPGAPPGSYRMFDWADGLYLGGFLNRTPTQYVEFKSNGIAIVSGTNITVQAPNVTISASTQETVTSPITALSGKLGWNGATPPAQVTGFGTPSGGAVIPSFNAASYSSYSIAVAEAVAEILTIMKAHGMIGA